MLVAAAVCPCPPLLVPEVAAGAAPELDTARAACVTALEALAAARPDRLVVVGPTDRGSAEAETYEQGTHGTFRGFGVDLDVYLGQDRALAVGTDPGAPSRADDGLRDGDGSAKPEHRTLPTSLAVAAWLLGRVRWTAAPVQAHGVGEPMTAERCVGLGDELAAGTGRVALLAMGDASACRTLKAPGYLDERATRFDAAVARALGTADTAALRALDAGLAHELKAAGRGAWQVLAGAGAHGALEGTLLYDEAPYGVGYLVASWT